MDAECSCEKPDPGVIVELARKPMYIPSRLHALLSTVREINIMSTLEEVLGAVKDYIYEHTLYDFKDPRVINCQKDELGNVLGVHQFNLFEINRLLLKVILKENDETLQDLRKTLKATVKRNLEEDNIDAKSENSKRFCLSPILSKIKLQSERCSTESDEDNSSDDSSDDAEVSQVYFKKENIIAIKHMYDVEYEIESDSASDTDASVTDTDSEVEVNILEAAFITAAVHESDEEFWADQSCEEQEINSDVEITESDKWKCKKCGIVNKPPMRYCLKCFEQRKGWLADRPERVRPPRKRRNPEKERKNREHSPEIDDVKELCEINTQIDTIKPAASKSEKLCILCCLKPSNATVVHGKIGHQFSCYKCARRLMSQNKTCPVCRRPIERVIHQICF